MKQSKFRFLGTLGSAVLKLRPKRTYTSAVILAAGVGKRMGTEQKKQWMEIGGLPVVVRSLLSFENCDQINEIIVVCGEGEAEKYALLAEKYGVSKFKTAVSGGNTRQASSLEGFKAISDKATHVAIHDAARCLVTPEMITDVWHKAVLYGAAIASCKASDTVKEVNSGESIVQTPDRSVLRLAQTPQIFRTEIYRASAYVALRDGIEVTDDASMAEYCAFDVKTVDTGKENVKITEKTDIYIAEAILRKRDAENAEKLVKKEGKKNG